MKLDCYIVSIVRKNGMETVAAYNHLGRSYAEEYALELMEHPEGIERVTVYHITTGAVVLSLPGEGVADG